MLEQLQESHTHASCPREEYSLPRETQRLLGAAIRVQRLTGGPPPSEPQRGPVGDQGAEKDKDSPNGHLGELTAVTGAPGTPQRWDYKEREVRALAPPSLPQDGHVL